MSQFFYLCVFLIGVFTKTSVVKIEFAKELVMSESGDLWSRSEVLCDRLIQLRDSL